MFVNGANLINSILTPSSSCCGFHGANGKAFSVVMVAANHLKGLCLRETEHVDDSFHEVSSTSFEILDVSNNKGRTNSKENDGASIPLLCMNKVKEDKQFQTKRLMRFIRRRIQHTIASVLMFNDSLLKGIHVRKFLWHL